MRPSFPLDGYLDRLLTKQFQKRQAHEQKLMAMLRDLTVGPLHYPVKIRPQVR